jgi:hypothetical protein
MLQWPGPAGSSASRMAGQMIGQMTGQMTGQRLADSSASGRVVLRLRWIRVAPGGPGPGPQHPTGKESESSRLDSESAREPPT